MGILGITSRGHLGIIVHIHPNPEKSGWSGCSNAPTVQGNPVWITARVIISDDKDFMST